MIEQYLSQLRAGLRTSSAERERILAEAWDHLQESIEAGRAAGLTEAEAQEAAISAFGSVRAVVRAHRRPRSMLVRVALAGWGLGGVTMVAIGASGLVAAVFNRLAGPSFVGGAPAGTRFSDAHCKHWQAIWHVATCSRAAMLESSSDAVSLRLLAGIGGLLVLAGYLAARRVTRTRGPLAGPVPPVLVAGCFGTVTVGLVLLAGRLVPAPLLPAAGPGWSLSGALVTAALTFRYVIVTRRTRAVR